MIALPLGDLKQSSNALQTGLLHPANQPASPTPICKNFIKKGHVKTQKFQRRGVYQNTDGLGEYKPHQVETNLGTRETGSNPWETLESMASCTTDL